MESLFTTGAPASMLIITVLQVILNLDNVISTIIVSKVFPLDPSGLMHAPAKIGDFVNYRPSIQILTLSFLLIIGTLPVAEAFQNYAH